MAIEPHDTQAAADVANNEGASRFELAVGDALAFLDYVVSDGRLHLVHTEVPPALEGRGYGARLARAALDFARRSDLRVVPQCGFVRGYIERHPEYRDLVDPQAGGQE